MGAGEAAGELMRLLSDPDLPHRARWEAHRPAQTGQLVNKRSVGHVLAAALVERGDIDDVEEPTWSHRHKDTVLRALGGTRLTAPLIDLFADAFDFPDNRRSDLRSLLRAPRSVVVRSTDAVPEPASPDRVRTVSVYEEHHLDARGIPVLHRTRRTVEALADGVTRVPYLFDTESVVVDVDHGGGLRADAGVTQARPGIWQVQIDLDPPALGRGERRTVTFTTYFDYARRPDPVFRRGGPPAGPALDVSVAVVFDADRLPRQIHSCYWPDVESEPDTRTAVPLGPDNVVRTEPTLLTRGLVGFLWSWN